MFTWFQRFHAYPRNPFGFATNYRGKSEKAPGDIEILTSKGFQYVAKKDVTKNSDIIDAYKILIGRLVPSNGELDVKPSEGYKVITDTRIIGPGQINTETYLDIGVCPQKIAQTSITKTVEHIQNSLHLRFPYCKWRLLLYLIKITKLMNQGFCSLSFLSDTLSVWCTQSTRFQLVFGVIAVHRQRIS